MMVVRVSLKGILNEYFRLISSLMKSTVILESFAIKSKVGLKICLRHRIFGELPILCITGFKDEETE